MNLFYKKLVILALSLSIFANLQSEIIEMPHMNELHQYLKPDTLILFDIDNTLVEPVQELGSDQWFYHQFETYLESGMLLKNALTKALCEWHAIQQITDVKIVEAGTDKIIHNLQEEGFKMIGLTTRGLEISSCTSKQLKKINIYLAKSTLSDTDRFLINSGRSVLFHDGILFTSASHKGKAFFKFLDQIDFKPKHVVFINDKATHIREIEETCEEFNVPFIGLRYGFLDEKVKNFQKEVAEIQYKNFNILSDQEALNILNAK